MMEVVELTSTCGPALSSPLWAGMVDVALALRAWGVFQSERKMTDDESFTCPLQKRQRICACWFKSSFGIFRRKEN